MRPVQIPAATLRPTASNMAYSAAGFRDITIRRDEQRHWLCVTAEK